VTAVVEGAAYFASMRERKLEQSPSPVAAGALRIKAVFNRGTQESEEMFAAKVDGSIEGLSYRITREDGGFDTGTRTLQPRITEDLPLRQGEYNQFTLRISDRLGNAVPHDLSPIQIAQGMITPPGGQPASHDISLVVDDFTQDRTQCDCLFAKNQLLPARKTKTVTANKTVLKGSEDFIWIKVVEGDHNARPESINEIGVIQISGNQLESDLYNVSDIEL
jgi:molecular chaperone DnaK